MAEITKFKNRLGHDVSMLNVTSSVGANAVNSEDDVLLVKALLNYANGYVRFVKLEDAPYPSDGTVAGLAKTIRAFQKYYNDVSKTFGKSSRLAVDGKINHARGGKFVSGTNRPWTISALDDVALDRAHAQKMGSAVEALRKLFPHLHYIFNVEEFFADD